MPSNLKIKQSSNLLHASLSGISTRHYLSMFNKDVPALPAICVLISRRVVREGRLEKGKFCKMIYVVEAQSRVAHNNI
jgi:hypothetical protein